MNKIENVYLMGLGGIGSSFAYRLMDYKDINLKVIAKKEYQKRIPSNGIVINNKVYKPDFIVPEDNVAPADLLIVCVKNYSLKNAIMQVKNFIGPNTQILSVLNGLDSEEYFAKAYGWDHVLYSFMMLGGEYKNGVAVFGEKGKVCFGELKNDPEHLSERVATIKKFFDTHGVLYSIPEDMRYSMWCKFASNASENMTSSVLNIPCGVFNVSKNADAFREAALLEIISVARAEGVNIPDSFVEERRNAIKRMNMTTLTSTLRDIRAGKRTEIDAFSGKVVELGKKHGIPTPIAQTIVWCINVIEERHSGLFKE